MGYLRPLSTRGKDVGICLVLGAVLATPPAAVGQQPGAQPSLKTIDIGFRGSKIELTPDGRHAVVAGPRAIVDETREYGLAVIDAKRFEVVAEKIFPENLRSYAFDNEAVYVAQQSSLGVTKYDLKLKEQSSYLVTTLPDQMVRLPGREMAICAGYGGKSSDWSRLDVEKMSPVAEEPRPKGWFKGVSPIPVDTTTVEWDWGLVDLPSGRVIHLIGQLPLPPLFPPSLNRRPGPNQLYGSFSRRRWGVIQGSEERLLSPNGQTYFRMPKPSGYGLLLKQWPAFVTLRRLRDLNPSDVVFEIRNLRDGKVATEFLLTLAEGDVGSLMRNSMDMGTFNMVEVGNRVLLLLDQKIVEVPLPVEVLEKLPTLPHFAREQPLGFEMNPKGVNRIAPKVQHVVEGTKFSLHAPVEGIAIDERTGELTIETAQLWKKWLTPAPKEGPRLNVRDRVLQESTFNLETNAPMFERATGKKLPAGKFATWLPLQIHMTAPTGHIDVIPWSLVVLGPRDEVEQELKRREQERLAKRAARDRSQATEGEPEATGRSGPPAQPEENLEERVERLEERIGRIEQRLEEILQKLEEE